MEHRYGRHGPRAWLRWRQRRYGRPSRLPVPVEPQPTIVRVFVPTNAERIIFIIMQGTQDPDEENPNRQIVEMSAGQQMPATFPFVSSSLTDTSEMRSIGKDNSPLARMKGYARRQARVDVAKIKKSCESGQTITLQWNTITERNDVLAQNILWNEIFLKDSSPDDQEQDDLINAYQQEYKTAFDNGMDRYRPEVITNPHIARIRQIAMQDRTDFPPNRREMLNFHQRDLGMIRVLRELEVSLDMDIDSLIDSLPEVHRLTDEYDEYYKTPRKAVNWPDDLEPFPDLNI